MSLDKVIAALKKAGQTCVPQEVLCTIANSVTRGLHYLYAGCAKPIVHRGTYSSSY